MERVRLVDQANCQFVILHDPAWSDIEAFAAEELRHYVTRMSGAQMPIVDDAEGAKTLQLRTNNSSTALSRDAYILTVTETRITIAGNSSLATLQGTYALLALAGCRWYAPDYWFYGDAGGSVVPQQPTIELPIGSHANQASFTYRKKYVEEARSHTLETLTELITWMPKVGLNTFVCPTDCFHKGIAVWDNWREELTPELRRRGLTIEVGGHGYENFVTAEDIAATPEWAGMRPDGTREPDPGKRTFCTTNEAALAFFRDAVERYLRDRPEIDIFDLWPPDTLDWCDCPNCTRAGPIPYRHALVVNDVARLAQRVRPGLRVEFAAYYEPSQPPEGVVFEDNVLVDFCPITRSHEQRIYDPSCGINRVFDDLLTAWFETPSFDGSVSVYTYYRKYAWRSLPMLLPQLITDELRYYCSLGVDGIGSYSEPADWWTFELQHYLVARMSTDTTTDLDALLRRYFQDRYGPAHPHMRDIIALIEVFLPRVARIPGTMIQHQTVAPSTVYEFFRPTAELMRGYEKKVARCQELLRRAQAMPDLPEDVSDRLARWQALLRYVSLEVTARGLSLALADRGRGGYLQAYTDVTRQMAVLARENSDNGLILHPEWAEYELELPEGLKDPSDYVAPEAEAY